MEPAPRHQCVIYKGPPSRHLLALAAVAQQKLQENYRCLYLNSPPLVAGMKSYLAAAGVDVAVEIAKASLVLSSDRGHLVEGRFDVDRMMHTLEQALQQALTEGYVGLWATGDMTWEMGSQADFATLLEYEWRLEEFFRKHPQLCGISQYHGDTLPSEILRQGLLTHPLLFVNETLSRINPHFVRPEAFTESITTNPQLDAMIHRLCEAL